MKVQEIVYRSQVRERWKMKNAAAEEELDETIYG